MKILRIFGLILAGTLLLCVGNGLVTGCSEMEIQPDSLNTSEDGSLKGAKVNFVPFKSEFKTWGISQTYIFDEETGDLIGSNNVVGGIGKATHMGKTEIYFDQDWYFLFPLPPYPDPMAYTEANSSFITLTASNGDKLYLCVDAFMYSKHAEDGYHWEISGSCSIDGGTGRFEDATCVENLSLKGTFFKEEFTDPGGGETFITGEISY